MSLNHKKELVEIAKNMCRELRNNTTETEKLFWETARNKKFENKKFYRQFPFFYDLTGRESFFIADFYCYEERLIIELVGKIHQYKLVADKKRTEILNLLDLKIIRFNNDEIKYKVDEVLMKIKNEFSK